jgi:DNA invertase Pin-like site-specific DNA recombinase
MDDREGDNRSLGGQERECREWAEREGLTVGPVYREAVGASASRFSKKARPQMERALAEMGTSYRRLIVLAFDRATRKGFEEVGEILKTVEATDGRMVSVTDNVDTSKIEMGDRLSMLLRAEFVRDESEKIGVRVRRGK